MVVCRRGVFSPMVYISRPVPWAKGLKKSGYFRNYVVPTRTLPLAKAQHALTKIAIESLRGISDIHTRNAIVRERMGGRKFGGNPAERIYARHKKAEQTLRELEEHIRMLEETARTEASTYLRTMPSREEPYRKFGVW